MEDINIPLLSEQSTNNFDTSDSTQTIEEKQDIDFLLRVDFSMLSEDTKARKEEEINNSRSKLTSEIEKLQNEINIIKDPNFKVCKNY